MLVLTRVFSIVSSDWFYAKRLSLSVKKEAVNMDSTEAQVVSFSWGLTKVTS